MTLIENIYKLKNFHIKVLKIYTGLPIFIIEIALNPGLVFET